jgi:hypothetical protein
MISTRKYYYIQQRGVYPPGVDVDHLNVEWIGEDRPEAMKTVRSLARADGDSYHKWELWEYCVGIKTILYSTTKWKEIAKDGEEDTTVPSMPVDNNG